MKYAPLILFTLLLASQLPGEIPNRIPHQGRIAVDGTNFDGPGDFRFLLFTDSDDDHQSGNETALWSNLTTAPADLSEPATAISLPVTKGLYSLFLGDPGLANMAPLPASLETEAGELVYLRIWFDDRSNGTQQLAPDQPIGATAFALHAREAGKLPDGAVTSSMLANGAVTTPKLAISAVTPDKVAPNIQDGPTAVDPFEFSLNFFPSSNLFNFEVSAEFGVSFPQPFLTQPTVRADPGVSVTNVTETGFQVTRTINSLKIIENGIHPTAEIVDGRPSMAIGASNALGFLRAFDSRGEEWPEFVTFVTTEFAFSPSLAIVGGKPAIVYFARTTAPNTVTLRYVSAQDAEGSAWNPAVTILPAFPATQALPPILREVDGSPAVLFGDPVSGDLLFTRATDLLGQGWAPTETIAAPSTPGRTVVGNLAVIGGRPAVALVDLVEQVLRYVRADNPQGSIWPAPGIADPAAGSEFITGPVDLEVVDGHPAIAYYFKNDPGPAEVGFMRATDATGSAWGPRRRIYASANDSLQGGTLSLATIAGHPSILLRDRNTDSVHFAVANDVTGDTWTAPNRWATNLAEDNFQSFSLLEVEGAPAAAFRFFTSEGMASLGGALYLRFPGDPIEWTAESTDPGFPIVAQRAESVADRAIIAGSHAYSATLDTVRPHQYSLSGDELSLGVDFDEEFGTVPEIVLPSGEFQLSTVTTSGFAATATLNRAVIDANDDAGRFVSLAVADGHPAVAYQARSAAELRYARASDPLGTTWNSPIAIDSSSEPGPYVSLAIIAGHPAAVYYRRASGQLIYRRASNPEGTTWGNPFVIANVPTFSSGETSGHELALLEVEGRPAVSWFDQTIGLRYRRANNPSGSVWGSSIIAVPNDGPLAAGAGLSMAVVSGRPAISYLANNADSLRDVRYVRADDTIGSSWALPITVRAGSVQDFGPFGIVTTNHQGPTSLVLREGVPHILYERSSIGGFGGPIRGLALVKSGDTTGSSWGTDLGLPSTDESRAAAATVNGRISYSSYLEQTGTLEVTSVEGSSFDGSADGTTGDDVGLFSSLAEVVGSPGVAYYDSSNDRLKFVRIPLPSGRWAASDGTVAPITTVSAQISGFADTAGLAESVADGSVTASKLALGGEAGQVLRSTGMSVEWSDYGLILAGDSLTLRAANSVDLGQYFRDDGSEALTGTLTVTQGANFGSAIDVDGSVIAADASIKNAVVAGSHKLRSPQTFTRNIAGSSLIPREGQSFFRSELGFIRQNGTGINLYTNVQLPQGATVTAARLRYFDNTSNNFVNFRVRFRRRALTSTTAENIGSFDGAPPGGSSTTVRTLATTITASRGVINNQQFHYFMHVDSTANIPGSELRIYGFEIDYTLDTLLP